MGNYFTRDSSQNPNQDLIQEERPSELMRDRNLLNTIYANNNSFLRDNDVIL
jgi:hypothetical protein